MVIFFWKMKRSFEECASGEKDRVPPKNSDDQNDDNETKYLALGEASMTPPKKSP